MTKQHRLKRKKARERERKKARKRGKARQKRKPSKKAALQVSEERPCAREMAFFFRFGGFVSLLVEEPCILESANWLHGLACFALIAFLPVGYSSCKEDGLPSRGRKAKAASRLLQGLKASF